MNNLLVAIAVFVITVVGAMFAVPHFVDWNAYRTTFEEEASRAIGRQVEVDGDVTLHLLPVPYFRLEKIRVADASPQLTFFKADSLSVRLSIPPMFRGIVEANEIEFQRPIVRLAVDGKGQWNWQALARQLAAGSYFPANIALASVKIVDGTLALHGADGVERTRLQGIKGEFSAPSLEGPYRFRGGYRSGRAEREIRVATSAPEPDGGVRFRASLRTLDTGATYLLDGRASDLMRSPHVLGELTARLPIAGLWQSGPQPAPAKRPASRAEEVHALEGADAAFEVKANVKADAAGARLSDLALTFEQGGRPQILTGSVDVNWQNELALDMKLASRWLDLDRITGSADQSGPVEGIAKFAARIRDFAPGRKAHVTLDLEQASLGNESIGPVQVALKRTDDKLDIQDLRVALPGATRAELQGSLFENAQSVVFNGRLALRGTSVARFLTWATAHALPIEPRADGAFGLRAEVTADGSRVAARDIVGNLSGTTLNGSAEYRWTDTPALSVALEGPQIDARAFMPAGASLADLYEFLLRSTKAKQGAPDPQAASRPVWQIPEADLNLRINAGQLATAGRVYRDVAAVMELKSGNLRQVQLRLSGDEGYTLELNGAVDAVRTKPKGTLRGLAVASSAKGITPLAELVELPAAFRPVDARATAAVPLRIAGSMAFGTRTEASRDLILDGSAGGVPVRVGVRSDGGPDGWRAARTEVTATADAPDGRKVASLLAPSSNGTISDQQPGRLVIKAVGVPKDGLSTIGSFAAGQSTIAFKGQVSPLEVGLKGAGELDVRIADAAPLVALSGLVPAIRLDGTPMNGKLHLAFGDEKLVFEKLALMVGGKRLSGDIQLSRVGERRRVDANIDVDELRVAQLLAPLLDQRLAIAGVAEAAVSGQQSIWPDAPFSAEPFQAFAGNVHITAKQLVLGDGLALGGAKLNVALDPAKIDVKELSGSMAGGELNAQLEISKAPAGAEVQGKLKAGAALKRLGQDAGATGTMNVALQFSGRGLTPRSVVSALQGRGSIAFAEAKVAALWPGAIDVAADAAIKAPPGKLAEAVRETLAPALSGGSLSLGEKTIPLEIADGFVRAQAVTIETGEGRVTGSASLDLKALAVDSHWRVEGAAGTSERAGKPLPAVTVTYSGPLAALGKIEPRIDAATLEQEISARKIERDVEELERLRRVDEQRRLIEAERLRKQFNQTPPVQRPPLPMGVPVTPSSQEIRPAPSPPG